MEPRIATLLGGSPSERASLDLLSLPPLATTPRGRQSSEPGAVRDDASASPAQRTPRHTESQPPTKRQKTSVPIAGVLNNETPTTSVVHSVTATSSLPPFSGRLSDLLLDPSQQHSNKKRRLDEQAALPALSGPENNPLTLPKPPQLPKKPAKRPRIPPLLQGLHQPPPLPEGRLFPPITGEGGGFSRNIGEREGGSFGRNIGEMVGLRSPIRPDRTKEKEKEDLPNILARQESVDETREDLRREADKTASKATSDKENQESTTKRIGLTTTTKTKDAKKRNKWSEQETKDLLVGVSRFGIGNWKKILQCSDFAFNQRTAVDLKDRFRTCCPGEGLKLKIKKTKRKSTPKDSSAQESHPTTDLPIVSHGQTSSISDSQIPESSTADSVPKKSRLETNKKGPVELAKFGIHAPFVKNKRRERREFTEKDDENLMKGFEKHTFSWHSMRDDADLGFSSRHPTDLRDRFRIRYPEIFAKAGYKLKPKHELVMKEKEREVPINQDSSVAEQSVTTHKAKEAATASDLHAADHGKLAATNANLGPLALREPLHNSFPSPLEDFADLASEEDMDGTQSPIVLNRNIFEWADANPSLSTSVTTANLPAVTSLMGESHLNFFNGTDGMHINPLATLNLPMALLTSSMLSAMPSHMSTSNTPSRGGIQYSHSGSTSTPSTSAPATGVSVFKPSMDPLLRTPNLPTIVFPHVPASSARSAVHNLPPPTDLLSGLDMDPRADSHTTGFMLDDTISFSLSANASGYDPNATLAPMMGGAVGRGILSLERHLMDESSTERRI
jgi:hypothetical protein